MKSKKLFVMLLVTIVAREYGIPAVVATGVGSYRIQDGLTISVDGSAGTVELKLQA